MRYVGIDPSTKTGVVILNAAGELIDCMEITAAGKDPERMAGIIDETLNQIEQTDYVCIEGFGFASQSGFLLGGIGWGIRLGLFERSIHLSVAIFKRWGFEHKSDNVRDAYILAQVARALYVENVELIKAQREVLEVIMNPPVKKRKVRKG